MQIERKNEKERHSMEMHKGKKENRTGGEREQSITRGGGLGLRPKKMYGERLGDGIEYHLISPTPHC